MYFQREQVAHLLSLRSHHKSLAKMNACNTTFSKDQVNSILVTLSSTGIVSSITCLTAALMVPCLKLYKQFAYRLALYQVLASLFFSLIISLELMAFDYDSKSEFSRKACEAVGFLTQYSTWVKVMFTLCLTFHLFCFAVFLKNFQRLELGYVFSSIFIPLLHSWIPFIHNSFGLSGAWCWIREWEDDCMTEKYEEGIIEVFALWYGPVIVPLTLNSLGIAVIVITMLCRAYQPVISERDTLLNREMEQKRRALRQLLPLLAYPILFFFLMLMPFAHRIYDAAAQSSSYPLTLAHAVAIPCWGLFSGLTLIAHIFSVHCHKIKCACCKKMKFYHNMGHLAAQPQYDSCRTVTSTNTGTAFFILPESEVDNKYLNT